MLLVDKPAPFRYQVTCPHCWTVFPSEKILWIAESPDLTGDSRLGEFAKQRFLPIGFTPEGNALDLRGFPCHRLACPHCHLPISRSSLEMPPYFISIVGAPSSGKSYFLAAMTWTLRKVFSQYFTLSFADADMEMNSRLQQYEEMQFSNNNPENYVQLRKTEKQGDLYHEIILDGQSFTYSRPFQFSLCPVKGHPSFDKKEEISRLITMYDNAGEHYLPSDDDGDTASKPVTRHLGISECFFFLFDPIQDINFRTLCASNTNEPQLCKTYANEFRWTPLRQEMVMTEMINRTRQYRNIPINRQISNPVVVIVTKYDAWKDMLPINISQQPWIPSPNGDGASLLQIDYIRQVSNAVRCLFVKHIPDFVATIEQFASDIIYIPVSATGGPPVLNPETDTWGFQVKNIKPLWTEVPLLYALAQTKKGLISIAKPQS